MKFGELRSIAHNIADSFAETSMMDGCSIYDEAARTVSGVINVDFLSGTWPESMSSKGLQRLVQAQCRNLPLLLEKRCADPFSLRWLTAEFKVFRGQLMCSVTLEDRSGKRVLDDYVGSPLRRVRCLDQRGRILPKMGRISSPLD